MDVDQLRSEPSCGNTWIRKKRRRSQITHLGCTVEAIRWVAACVEL
jgi:hypothetical protein